MSGSSINVNLTPIRVAAALAGDKAQVTKRTVLEKLQDIFSRFLNRPTHAQALEQFYNSTVEEFHEFTQVSEAITTNEFIDESVQVKIHGKINSNPLSNGTYNIFMRLKDAAPKDMQDKFTVAVTDDGVVEYSFDDHCLYRQEVTDLFYDVQNEQCENFYDGIGHKIKDYIKENNDQFYKWRQTVNNEPDVKPSEKEGISADEKVPAIKYFLLHHPEGIAYKEFISKLDIKEQAFKAFDASMMQWQTPDTPLESASAVEKQEALLAMEAKYFLGSLVAQCELLETEKDQPLEQPTPSLHLHPEAAANPLLKSKL